jgi:hypothetical protein
MVLLSPIFMSQVDILGQILAVQPENLIFRQFLQADANILP